MTVPAYTDLQRDALGELANVGCGQAGTALGMMLGRTVELTVPTVRVLDLADAVDALGPGEDEVTAVVLPTTGDLEAAVLLLFDRADVARLSTMLGVDPADVAMAESAIGEIGNIIGTSYLNAVVAMSGGASEPAPPVTMTDMRAALVSTALASGPAGAYDAAILVDCRLSVEGEACSLVFVLLAGADDIDRLLERIGLGREA
ncbi:MAG: chemotaxis protein CheC [Solirubrobacteraceae bacterium]